jgi:hypothetical protein
MLGGAREFRYDWILLRARNLPHEAGGTPATIILRGYAVWRAVLKRDFPKLLHT